MSLTTNELIKIAKTIMYSDTLVSFSGISRVKKAMIFDVLNDYCEDTHIDYSIEGTKETISWKRKVYQGDDQAIDSCDKVTDASRG